MTKTIRTMRTPSRRPKLSASMAPRMPSLPAARTPIGRRWALIVALGLVAGATLLLSGRSENPTAYSLTERCDYTRSSLALEAIVPYDAAALDRPSFVTALSTFLAGGSRHFADALGPHLDWLGDTPAEDDLRLEMALRALWHEGDNTRLVVTRLRDGHGRRWLPRLTEEALACRTPRTARSWRCLANPLLTLEPDGALDALQPFARRALLGDAWLGMAVLSVLSELGHGAVWVRVDPRTLDLLASLRDAALAPEVSDEARHLLDDAVDPMAYRWLADPLSDHLARWLVRPTPLPEPTR